MDKKCTKCGVEFQILDEDLKFYLLFEVPASDECPECRLISRLMHRNSRKLYIRKCDFTGKQVVSQFHAGQAFPVYHYKDWWEDSWDAADYGMDFDFSRPFFEQFQELVNKVPHLSLFNFDESRMINSEYNNCAGDLKNCYLICESDLDEDCAYSNTLKKCKNVMDSSICIESELCYECIDCFNCYNLKFSQDCQSCQSSYFLNNCKSCNDCIGCINQNHKQYMIFNKQMTKEEYEAKKLEFHLNSSAGIENARNMAEEFFKTQILKDLFAEQNENSFGNHLYNSKNAYYCFDSRDLEDCRYCSKLFLGTKTSMDYTSWGGKAELLYFCTACGDNAYNLKFCTNCCTNVSNLTYCDLCVSSKNLFGCVGIKKREYCILNKQYSKEEYEVLKARIIEHMRASASADGGKKDVEWGKYFPVTLSPFAYNESLAQEFFPLTKEDAISKGYKWKDDEIKPANSENLACNECAKNYKLIAQEVAFYSKMDLPNPEKCPDCRHKNRMGKRTTLKLWNRSCSKCSKSIQTSYSPDRPENVYCESCYLAEVY